jgi:hemin uptake protein HemP
MSAKLPDDTANAAKQTGDQSVERAVIVNENRIDSRDLFSTSREITISHGEETYRLRLTSQNKLILTK